jgi:hypothetical protein
MKTIKLLFIIATLSFSAASCKKDKLTDDNNVLVGTWTSISTAYACGFNIGQPENPNLKLELKEKGKYTLFSGDKKTETGRILLDNGLVTFKCGEKKSALNGRKILAFNADTLNIDRNVCNDDYEYRFTKN